MMNMKRRMVMLTDGVDLQGGPLDLLKKISHLLAGRAVDARVGHVLFPGGKEKISAARLWKLRPLTALFWAYFTPASTFPLCRGSVEYFRPARRAN
jgi:hypothetical protein